MLSRDKVEASSGQLLAVVFSDALVLDCLSSDTNKIILRKTALIPNIRTNTDPKIQKGKKNCK
jgi:hypothetical protein